MPERVILSIGTKKGLFVAHAAKGRRRFSLRGPFGTGVAVYSTLIDRRGTPRIFASSCNAFFGMKVLVSSDLARSSKRPSRPLHFPKKDGRAVANIWSLEPGKARKELWCGVEPASLFHSEDNGNSWELVAGISNHKHARQWQPGNGGLCMHTIIRDGDRMHLGISTGGHYLSEDGGQTFTASNNGVGAGFVPDPYPEFGQCVHKIARHDDAPGRLYMQNHGGWEDRPGIGVLRSDDHGQTWRSIAKGLPSDFGFPIVVHPHNPDVVYVVPFGTDDENLSERQTCSLAKRKRRQLVASVEQGFAQEGILLHSPPRRDGCRRPEFARPLLRLHHRPTLDGPRRGRRLGVPVRFAAADQLRKSGRRLAGDLPFPKANANLRCRCAERPTWSCTTARAR